MAKIARNAPCVCGSGRKWKKCCGRTRNSDSGPPELVPQSVKNAVDQMMKEEGYTSEVALKLQELERQKKQKRRRGMMRGAALFGAVTGFTK